MGILFILLFVACQQGESITVKTYGHKHSVGGMFFNAIICLAATLFFFIVDKDGLTFTKELVLWGLGSCLLFAAGFFGSFMAYRYGSYIATKLVNSFAVVISIFYGIFFLKEKAELYTYIAVVLFFVSMFLINYTKTERKDRRGFSFRWLFFVLLSAFSNGFISILMREQQLRFDSSLDNEFMIISLGGASLFLFVMGFVRERENVGYILKNSSLYGIAAGMFNGAANFAVLLAYNYIPISVAEPLKAGLTFIVSFFISLILFRERFTKSQVAGVIIGIVSVVMFNI